MKSFDTNVLIKNMTKATNEVATKIVHRALEHMVDELMFLSPVGQPDDWVGSVPKDYEPGKYKANWQYSTNAPITTVLDMRDESQPMDIDSSTSKHIKSKIKENKNVFTTHYFTNNVPYAEAIEYGSAIHNPQAQTQPYAVAGLVSSNIQKHLDRAKQEILK